MTALAAPLRAALASLSPDKIAQLKAQVFDARTRCLSAEAFRLTAVPLMQQLAACVSHAVRALAKRFSHCVSRSLERR